MGHPPGTSRDITGVCISGHPRLVPPGCPSMTSIMSDVIAGRIELLDPLARGATGSLWRAIDRRHGAICAAKVMRQRDGADVLRFVREQTVDRKSTRLNSSHVAISYAVFCLKKKKGGPV